MVSTVPGRKAFVWSEKHQFPHLFPLFISTLPSLALLALASTSLAVFPARPRTVLLDVVQDLSWDAPLRLHQLLEASVR